MMYSKLGHTFFFNNTDVFVESDTRKITDALVVKILNAYQNKTGSFFNIDSDVINYFKPRIQYALWMHLLMINLFWLFWNKYRVDWEIFPPCFLYDSITIKIIKYWYTRLFWKIWYQNFSKKYLQKALTEHNLSAIIISVRDTYKTYRRAK